MLKSQYTCSVVVVVQLLGPPPVGRDAVLPRVGVVLLYAELLQLVVALVREPDKNLTCEPSIGFRWEFDFVPRIGRRASDRRQRVSSEQPASIHDLVVGCRGEPRQVSRVQRPTAYIDHIDAELDRQLHLDSASAAELPTWRRYNPHGKRSDQSLPEIVVVILLPVAECDPSGVNHQQTQRYGLCDDVGMEACIPLVRSHDVTAPLISML